MSASELSIAQEFSKFPAGRYVTDGKFSGQQFRELLVERLKNSSSVTVTLDGTMGYGSSFLEEAFGGLVRLCGYSAKQLHARLTLKSSDRALVTEIWSYIDAAKP